MPWVLTSASRDPNRNSTPADAEMPADFLKVESKAWSKWLDETIHISWTRVLLKDVLAGEFGPAAFAVENVKALDTPITFNIRDTSRRTALWRLSQRYGFTIRWAQKGEPKVFMGLSEAEQRKHQVGGVIAAASPLAPSPQPRTILMGREHITGHANDRSQAADAGSAAHGRSGLHPDPQQRPARH